MQGLKLRYKFVHDCCRFYWNNTVRVLPLPYCIIKYEYCKVLYVPYYRTYYDCTYSTRTDAVPTTVLYLLPTRTVLPTTYYLQPTTYNLLLITYYLLPITYYLLNFTYYLLPTVLSTIRVLYLLPTTGYYCTYYLLPTTCYLPTTYYLLPTYYLVYEYLLQYLYYCTFYLLYLLYLRVLPPLLGRVPPIGLILVLPIHRCGGAQGRNPKQS